MNFLPVYTYFIALSLLTSLLAYRKNWPVYLKILPPFLFLTLGMEVYCSYLSSVNRNNVTPYNFFSAFEFCFYLVLLSLIIRSRRTRTLIWITAAVYLTGALINIFLIQGIKTFHTTSYAAGCLLVVAFCIYYFYELFRVPVTGKLAFNPAFWICTGLLFFYCCGFPLYGLVNLWSTTWTFMVNSFTTITTILNIFLYSLFTIAFICTRTRNYILSPS